MLDWVLATHRSIHCRYPLVPDRFDDTPSIIGVDPNVSPIEIDHHGVHDAIGVDRLEPFPVNVNASDFVTSHA